MVSLSHTLSSLLCPAPPRLAVQSHLQGALPRATHIPHFVRPSGAETKRRIGILYSRAAGTEAAGRVSRSPSKVRLNSRSRSLQLSSEAWFFPSHSPREWSETLPPRSP